MTKHRVQTVIVIYLFIGFGLSIGLFFLSPEGDLPRWSTIVQMANSLPEKLPDLLATVLFWVIIPALLWPLIVLFYLLT